MQKIALIRHLIFAAALTIGIAPINTRAAASFSLSNKENGIDGILEVFTVDSNTSKVRILDLTKNEVESHFLKGRDGRLDRIEGLWKNGPLYLVTADLGIGMGSYNGPYSQPFQVTEGHIQWAKSPNPIYLPKTAKTEWRARKIENNSQVEILEVSCNPDFDRTLDTVDEMKFKRTYARYRFNGHKWQQWSRSEEGCWETGDKFPDRNTFP